jgi:hypothetical protein
VAASNAYLAANPQLYEAALRTAWELAIRDQQGRLDAVLFDDDRRSRRKPRPPHQITAQGALKSLRFSVQPEVISDARAY